MRFEIDVLQRLGGRTLSAPQVMQLAEEGELVSLDFTGVGYFLTLRHHSPPDDRVVLADPTPSGKAGELETGFVAFVESGELTLECFSLGDEPVPENFRNADVMMF